MINTLALVSATLSLVAGAVTPTGPAPGAIYNAGATCPISWSLDTTATWYNMEIDLMTGSNLAMVKVATVAAGLDGTTGNGTYSWACPSVTPNSAIYFYQFTNGGINPAWTGRFTIASASGATTPPTNATQPDNTGAIVNIPWGTGRLSSAVVTPTNGTGVASISSTGAVTGNATRATTSLIVPTTTSAVALSTLASATTSSRATSTSALSTVAKPAASASTTATSSAHGRIAGSIVLGSLGAIGMWFA